MKCETCRFWLTLAGRQGQCRRHAPRPILAVEIPYAAGMDAVRPTWPVTMASHGCGDHKPRRTAVIFEALNTAAEAGELILTDGGLCHFHRRRDRQVTIREVIVLPNRRGNGVGRRMVEQAGKGATRVVARCPADLPSNGFWRHLGFALAKVEQTKTGRSINVWEMACA